MASRNIKAKALQIKTETQARANSANRVGGLFEDIADELTEIEESAIQADNEDLAIENGLLKIKNRVAGNNGMGYKILRKNESFASQVTLSNTIYEIRYNFSITGLSNLSNVTLLLNGGSLTINSDIVFRNMLGLSLIAFGEETISANSEIQESGQGIVSFVDCAGVRVSGIKFVYNDVYKNFIYTNNCTDMSFVGNEFGGLTQERTDGGWKKCIYSIADKGIFITNNIFRNVHGGLTLGNYQGIDKDVMVSNNIFENAYVSAINTFAENATFSSNTFRNVGFGGEVTCIAICGSGPVNDYPRCESYNVSVCGNSFENVCNAVQADCHNGGFVSNITLVGNSIADCKRAFYMANTKSELVVSNNVMSAVKTIGIDLSNVSNAIVSSNFVVCNANAQFGIRLKPFDTGYEYYDSDNVLIKDNTIENADDGVYVGESTEHISKNVRISNNVVTGCGRGIVASEHTLNLVLENNRLENTTDIDIRTSSFEDVSNKYAVKSALTEDSRKYLDTSTDTPVVKQDGTYYIDANTDYVLRNFAATDNVKKIHLVALTDNVTVAFNNNLKPANGTTLKLLSNQEVVFEKIGAVWVQMTDNGILRSLPAQPSSTRRFGQMLFDGTLNMPIISVNTKWLCADGYKAVTRKGDTSSRPTLQASDAGFQYFDTTLGKPTYWQGTKWVDAKGQDVSLLDKGTTANRPTLTSTDGGFCYFDTDLGKPIYWQGTKWVDATGADLT